MAELNRKLNPQTIGLRDNLVYNNFICQLIYVLFIFKKIPSGCSIRFQEIKFFCFPQGLTSQYMVYIPNPDPTKPRCSTI